jgi:hypothetical protein
MHVLDPVAGDFTTKEHRVPESRRESVSTSDARPVADFGGIFPGGVGPEPINIEQPTRATGRLLNLKDELR